MRGVLGQQSRQRRAVRTRGRRRETGADHGRPAVAKLAHAAVDARVSVVRARDRVEIGFAGRPRREVRAVIGEHLERMQIVRRVSPARRVRAAAVVADHPPERAVAVGHGVGAEGEPVRLGAVAQRVEHDARLDPGAPRRRVERVDRVHMLREVDHDGSDRGLALEARAGPAAHDRHAARAAQLEGTHGVVAVPRQDHAEGKLSHGQRRAGIDRAARHVEAHLAAQVRGELLAQVVLHPPRSVSCAAAGSARPCRAWWRGSRPTRPGRPCPSRARSACLARRSDAAGVAARRGR